MHVALFGLGAFGVLGHAPVFFQPAFMLALVVLVWALDDARRLRRPARAGFARAWSFAAGQFLAGTFWVANAFLVSAEDHAWLIWAPLTLLPGGLALFWGVAGAAYVRFAPRGPQRTAIFAACFLAVELLRSHILSGFPWNLPGHVFPGGGEISQIASVIGASGLSALVLYAFAAPAALAGPGRPRSRVTPLAIGLVLVASAWGFGALRLAGAETEAGGERVRVVQLFLPQQDKRYARRHEILDQYLALTNAPGLEDVDAVIWPEGAIPAFLLNSPDLLAAIHATLPEDGLLITGTPRAEFDAGGEPSAYFNALAALRAGPERLYLEATYDKARLVPFGEGNPLRPLTRLIGFETLNQYAPSYDAGIGARTLDVEGLSPFAPLICYEVIYSRFAPRGSDRPDWLLNISNDSWYGNSAGPQQHLNQARYRSIEEGLPLVRAASAGISGLINPYGIGIHLLPIDATQAIDIDLPRRLDETVFARYGSIPWMIVFIIVVILTDRMVRHGYAKSGAARLPRGAA